MNAMNAMNADPVGQLLDQMAALMRAPTTIEDIATIVAETPNIFDRVHAAFPAASEKDRNELVVALEGALAIPPGLECRTCTVSQYRITNVQRDVVRCDSELCSRVIVRELAISVIQSVTYTLDLCNIFDMFQITPAEYASLDVAIDCMLICDPISDVGPIAEIRNLIRARASIFSIKSAV